MLLRRIIIRQISTDGVYACGAAVQCGNTTKLRSFSMTSCRHRTKGPIKLKSSASNLQKLKHLKYLDEFVSKEIDRYKLSTRRLANMMGDDPDTYTEEDVKKAVRYLFPSDLDEDVLPSMDHPSKIYTSRLRILWDENKRPLHYLYYTKKPNANQLLHEIYQYVLDARKMNAIKNKTDQIMNLEGTKWMTKEELTDEVLDGEVVNDFAYKQVLAQFDRLLQEKHANIANEFVMKHRKPIPVISMMDNIKEAQPMADGRKFVEEDGQKKSAIVYVKVIYPGTGKITVNEKDFHKHFRFLEDRQTVLAPFTFLRQLARYDVEATVEGGTTRTASIGNKHYFTDPNVRSASQAVAIRLAIARGLRTFIAAEEVEIMRRAGLLTFDKRWKERKIYGQHKARKKHTWKRR